MYARMLLLALLTVTLAAAKTYTFSLLDTTRAGSTTLNAGQYSVKVEGSKIVLKDSTGHEVTAKAKVENSDRQFRDTEVSVTGTGGNSKIEWIGLGGSKSKIIFE